MCDRVDATTVPEIGPSSGESCATNPTKPPLQLSTYKFCHRTRGKAVIINNRFFDQRLTGQLEREGTEVDADALVDVFTMLGFDVVRHDNLRTIDMSMTLREVASADHSEADAFVCAILSHGEEGVVYGTNGTMKLNAIFEMFRGDRCQGLVGKPKLFFIQACRGRRYDWGVENEDQVDSAVTGHKIPVEADFLMAFSVCPGYFSWRNNVDGSWFVQALVRVLREKCQELDLMSMMTLTSSFVANDFISCTDSEFTSDMKQMPCLVSTLTKLVKFKSDS